MVDIFDMFETNDDAEKDGIEFDFGPVKALLARSGGGNTEWYKQLNKEVKKSGKANWEAVDSDEKISMIKKIFCKAIIKDHFVKTDAGEWERGVMIKKDGKKEIVPFTTENMITCLTQLPEYFKQLQEFADDYKMYRQSLVEEHSKN